MTCHAAIVLFIHDEEHRVSSSGCGLRHDFTEGRVLNACTVVIRQMDLSVLEWLAARQVRGDLTGDSIVLI